MLTLLACGDVSNGIFAEDADYLAALPSEEHQRLEFADAVAGTAKSVGDDSELYGHTANIADGANAFVDTVLEIVDYVRSIPPSARGENSRTWGPYATSATSDMEATVSRTGTGRFDWAFTCIQGSEQEAVTWGTHYAGDTVAEGDGAFTWDAAAAAWCSGEVGEGRVDIDYDSRAGVDIVMDIRGWSDGTADPADAGYAFSYEERTGDFEYAVRFDLLTTTDALELVEVRSRWVGGEGGRSDAIVSEGDMEATELRWTECWDVGGVVEHQEDNLGYIETEGDPESCVYEDFGEVERI